MLTGGGTKRHVGRQRVFAYFAAMNEYSPIVSEFDTPEQAAAYERWLAEKVAASLADQRPPVLHEEAMARARAIIEAGRTKKC